MNNQVASRMHRKYSLMVALICSVLTISCTGCHVFERFRQPAVNAPVAFQSTPSLQELLQQLNQQSASVRQVKSEVRVAMDGVPGRLKGTLTVERPRRLRLSAGVAGITELGVDVGSNDDVFWIWSRANVGGQTPVLYFADHVRYQSSQIKTMLPLEPTWLIDALGFVEFSPNDRHEGPFPRSDGRLEIHTYQQAGGKTSTRVSVIEHKYGWIVQQAFYDEAGRRLAYVDSIKHKYYPEANASLPQKIDIHVFQPDGQPLKLSVQAEDYTINALYGDPAHLWTMPNPQDVPKVDLTQVTNPQYPTNPKGIAPLTGGPPLGNQSLQPYRPGI